MTTLTKVTAKVDFEKTSIDFSLMRGLTSLTIDSVQPISNAAMLQALQTTPAQTLSTLSIEATLLTDSRPLLQLEKLNLLAFQMDENATFSLNDIPLMLTQLTIDKMPHHVQTMDFAKFASLVTLNVDLALVNNITQWPPNVQSISISGARSLHLVAPLPSTASSFSVSDAIQLNSFPDDFFSNCTLLASLFIINAPSFSSLPSNLSMTSLTSFVIDTVAIADPEQLCHLPEATLQWISIKGHIEDTTYVPPFPLPPCFVNFRSLINVQISDHNNMPPNALDYLPRTIRGVWSSNVSPSNPLVSDLNWTRVVETFPLLSSLIMTNSSISGTFPDQLRLLTSLGTISLPMNALTGTLKQDVLSDLADLRMLDLSYNSLYGTVPAILPASLFTLSLSNNSFEALPDAFHSSSSSPLSLSSLSVDRNSLTSLPDEAFWGNLDSLQVLNLGNNPTLRNQPLPHFWANHSRLSGVYLQDCGFVGTIPPIIDAPSLTDIELSQNSLCGPLPNFSKPNQAFSYVNFSNNLLSGTIPTSYSTQAFQVIDLSSNHLAGDFSNVVLSSANRDIMVVLVLSNNDFFGAMPNMQNLRNLNYFEASNTLIDLCASTPQFSPSVQSCVSKNLPNGGSSMCKAWYSACDAMEESCTIGNRIEIEQQNFDTCGASLLTLPTIATCDASAQPIADCVCFHGSWAHVGNVNGPLTVSSPLIIFGNLSAPIITITNVHVTIVVHGCIDIETVELLLTPEQVQELQKDPDLTKHFLAQLGSNCPTELSDIPVLTGVTRKSCKKVKASTPKSDSSNLFVTLQVNSNACNLWWIVLVSVFGGIIAVTLVVVAVLAKHCRETLSPYYKS